MALALSPGSDQRSSGTTARSRAHSSHASALSLPCSGQSVWGMTRTKRPRSQLGLRPASQALMQLMEGTRLGAGSPGTILTTLSVPSTYFRRVFPLCFRNFPTSLAASAKKAKFRAEMFQKAEACSQQQGVELNTAVAVQGKGLRGRT